MKAPAPKSPTEAGLKISDSTGAQEALENGLQALSLALPSQAIERIAAYCALLQKWGKVYNLTALLAPKDVLQLHVLDSLALIAPLRRELLALSPTPNQRFLDVGSGAGLPGVLLAICCPDLQVDCVDAVGKKAAFIQQAALELRLPNLRGLHARVETIHTPYTMVGSRAFAALPDFVAWSRQALAPGGVWVAMKGKQPTSEIAALPSWAQVFHVEPIRVPGLEAERCVVWLKQVETRLP